MLRRLSVNSSWKVWSKPFRRICSGPAGAGTWDERTDIRRIQQRPSQPLLRKTLAGRSVDRADAPLRILVQTVLRPDSDSRLYAGIIASGSLRRGDPIQLAHSAQSCRVNRIVVAGEESEQAGVGASVALGLDRHVDVTLGDMLVGPDRRPQVTDQFEAHLIWMSEQPLLPGREYILKVGVRSVPASVTAVTSERTTVSAFAIRAAVVKSSVSVLVL